MKGALFMLLLLIISCTSNRKIKSTIFFSCENICGGIRDANLYDSMPNGGYVFRANFVQNNIYEIRCREGVYYVTDSLMNIIMTSIEKNKCKNINIKKIKEGDTIGIR